MKLYRAIKRIPRVSAQTASLSLEDSFPTEAVLLKNLNHPGIPLIYDIDEDDDFIYMIEEYIQGESLDVFLSHQKNISQELIIQLGIQICDILDYLHHLSPYPILYQDLKPEHIILCGNQFKLVDFGIASYFTGSDNQFQSYGTNGFAAPEALNGLPVTPACDIYSLGKILQYIIDTTDIHCSDQLIRIIKKAAAFQHWERFETAASLKNALLNECNLAYKHDSHLIKNIAVAGSKHGVGTTHIAISLVSVLNKKELSAVYYAAGLPEQFASIVSRHSSLKEQNGIFSYRHFKGVPAYGEGIEDPVPKDTIHVKDCGFLSSLTPDVLENTDLLLVVLSGSDWDMTQSLALADQLKEKKHVVFLCNYGNQKAARHFAHLLQNTVCCFPCDPDPYRVTAEKERLVSAILNEKGGKNKFLSLIKKGLSLM